MPLPTSPLREFQQLHLERGMDSYPLALSWAKLIIGDLSPVTGQGAYTAPSLLFPMEAVFEAFVAKHLQRQLNQPCVLRQQNSGNYLVEHNQQKWFRLKPDLLVIENRQNRLVLDTKWKLLDSGKSNRSEKYGIVQSDFYQMQSYGHSYLAGEGDVVLIYPKTEQF